MKRHGKQDKQRKHLEKMMDDHFAHSSEPFAAVVGLPFVEHCRDYLDDKKHKVRIGQSRGGLMELFIERVKT